MAGDSARRCRCAPGSPVPEGANASDLIERWAGTWSERDERCSLGVRASERMCSDSAAEPVPRPVVLARAARVGVGEGGEAVGGGDGGGRVQEHLAQRRPHKVARAMAREAGVRLRRALAELARVALRVHDVRVAPATPSHDYDATGVVGRHDATAPPRALNKEHVISHVINHARPSCSASAMHRWTALCHASFARTAVEGRSNFCAVRPSTSWCVSTRTRPRWCSSTVR